MKARSAIIFLASITTIAAGATAGSFASKKLIPCLKASKIWDKTYKNHPYTNTGKVVKTFRKYYFVATDGESFLLLDDTIFPPKGYPEWIEDGFAEVLLKRDIPYSIENKGLFAAKYLTLRLPNTVKQEINVLGKALFEFPEMFTREQQEQIRTAMICRLLKLV